jgi:hypothetical protein
MFFLYLSRVVFGTEHRYRAVYRFFHGYRKMTKGLTAFTTKMDCDQTGMGLLPVTSAVFLIA